MIFAWWDFSSAKKLKDRLNRETEELIGQDAESTCLHKDEEYILRLK